MGVTEMQRAPQWDDAVLAQLRDLYAPLRRFAAVVGRIDVEPDDLVQEAFTRFLSGDRSGVIDIGAYLRRSIVNIATNERRRHRRADAAHVRLGVEGSVDDQYPSALADLLSIDARDRALLYMVHVEGSPTADAADACGMSGPAARMALSRARKALRGTIEMEQGR